MGEIFSEHQTPVERFRRQLAGTIPRPGARIPAGQGIVLEIMEATGRRVLTVKIETSRPSTRPTKQP